MARRIRCTRTRDQYGCLLAYVWTGNQLFNGVPLEKGYTCVVAFPPNTKYVDQFRKIQDEAHNKKTGIWSIENYVTDNGFNDEAAAPKQEAVAPRPQSDDTCNIKRNISSKGEKIYHMPGQAFYDKTDAEEMFCTEEAAEILQVSKTTVTEWVKSGYIEAEKIKGKWMLNNNSLETFKVRWDSRFSRGKESN